MTDNIGIKITVDSTDFDKKMRQNEKTTANADKKIVELNKHIRELQHAGQGVSKVTEMLLKLANSSSGATNQLLALTRSLSKFGVSDSGITKIVSEIKTLNDALVMTPKAVQLINNEINKFGQNTKRAAITAKEMGASLKNLSIYISDLAKAGTPLSQVDITFLKLLQRVDGTSAKIKYATEELKKFGYAGDQLARKVAGIMNMSDAFDETSKSIDKARANVGMLGTGTDAYTKQIPKISAARDAFNALSKATEKTNFEVKRLGSSYGEFSGATVKMSGGAQEVNKFAESLRKADIDVKILKDSLGNVIGAIANVGANVSHINVLNDAFKNSKQGIEVFHSALTSVGRTVNQTRAETMELGLVVKTNLVDAFLNSRKATEVAKTAIKSYSMSIAEYSKLAMASATATKTFHSSLTGLGRTINAVRAETLEYGLVVGKDLVDGLFRAAKANRVLGQASATNTKYIKEQLGLYSKLAGATSVYGYAVAKLNLFLKKGGGIFTRMGTAMSHFYATVTTLAGRIRILNGVMNGFWVTLKKGVGLFAKIGNAAKATVANFIRMRTLETIMFFNPVKLAEMTSNFLGYRNALLLATDSTKTLSARTIEANANLTRATKIAIEYKVDVQTLTKEYSKFINAVTLSGTSMKKAEGYFRTFAKVARITNMSTQAMSGMFLALEQMISKGTVSMEELRRQLGQYIPGSMALASEAWMEGTGHMAEFYKEVKKGAVQSTPFLEKFAKVINEKFDTSILVKSLEKPQAAMVALQNTLTGLQALFGALISDTFVKVVKWFDEFAKSIGRMWVAGTELASVFSTIFGAGDIEVNLEGATESLSSFDLAMNSVGETSDKVGDSIDRFNSGVDKTKSIVTDLNENFKSIIGPTGTIGLLGAAFVGGSKALQLFGKALRWLFSPLTWIITNTSIFAIKMRLAASAILAFGSAILAFLASPLGLVIAAFVGVTTAVYLYVDSLHEANKETENSKMGQLAIEITDLESAYMDVSEATAYASNNQEKFNKLLRNSPDYTESFKMVVADLTDKISSLEGEVDRAREAISRFESEGKPEYVKGYTLALELQLSMLERLKQQYINILPSFLSFNSSVNYAAFLIKQSIADTKASAEASKDLGKELAKISLATTLIADGTKKGSVEWTLMMKESADGVAVLGAEFLSARLLARALDEQIGSTTGTDKFIDKQQRLIEKLRSAEKAQVATLELMNRGVDINTRYAKAYIELRVLGIDPTTAANQKSLAAWAAIDKMQADMTAITKRINAEKQLQEKVKELLLLEGAYVKMAKLGIDSTTERGKAFILLIKAGINPTIKEYEKLMKVLEQVDKDRALEKAMKRLKTLHVDNIKSLKTEIKSISDSTKMIKLKGRELARYNIKSEKSRKSQEYWNDITENGTVITADHVESLKLFNEELDLLAQKQIEAYDTQILQDFADEFTAIFENMGDSLIDVFADYLSGIEDDWSNFADDIKDIFKNMLRDLIKMAISNPIKIYGFFSGMFGGTSGAVGAGGATGVVGGADGGFIGQLGQMGQQGLSNYLMGGIGNIYNAWGGYAAGSVGEAGAFMTAPFEAIGPNGIQGGWTGVNGMGGAGGAAMGAVGGGLVGYGIGSIIGGEKYGGMAGAVGGAVGGGIAGAAGYGALAATGWGAIVALVIAIISRFTEDENSNSRLTMGYGGNINGGTKGGIGSGTVEGRHGRYAQDTPWGREWIGKQGERTGIAVSASLGDMYAKGQHIGNPNDDQIPQEDFDKWLDGMQQAFQAMGQLDDALIEVFDLSAEAVAKVKAEVEGLHKTSEKMGTPDFHDFVIKRYDVIFKEVSGMALHMWDNFKAQGLNDDNVMAAVDAIVMLEANLQGLANVAETAAQIISDMALTQTEVLAIHRDAVYDLIEDYDGTIEATQLLTAGLSEQREATIQLLLAIDQASKAINAMFSDTRERILTDTMTDEEKFNYHKGQADMWTARLATLTDPADILEATREINKHIGLSWSAQMSADPEAAKKNQQNYLDYLDKINKLAQDRLDIAKQEAVSEAALLAAAVRTAVEEAVVPMTEAAENTSEATGDMTDAVKEFGGHVTRFGQVSSNPNDEMNTYNPAFGGGM